VGAEEAALRCEIGSVHQILGCDVKLDGDEIADREEPGALRFGIATAGAFLAA
jgi:hypothetical protein